MGGFEHHYVMGGAPIKKWSRGVVVKDVAVEQMKNVARLPIIHSHVAAMPDCHWGMGAMVGSVMVLDILTGLGTSPIEVQNAAISAVGYCFGRRRYEIVGLDLDRQGDGDGWLERDAKTLAVHLVRHKTADGSVKPFRSFRRHPIRLQCRRLSVGLPCQTFAPALHCSAGFETVAISVN